MHIIYTLYRFAKSMSKSEQNLKILEDYDYETVQRYNSITDTVTTVYKCTFHGCGKEMETTWNMLDHARMHKGVKPFKWNYCDKRFTQKGNMRKHSRLHLTPNVESRRKYSCKFCSSKFTETYNLMVRFHSF